MSGEESSGRGGQGRGVDRRGGRRRANNGVDNGVRGRGRGRGQHGTTKNHWGGKGNGSLGPTSTARQQRRQQQGRGRIHMQLQQQRNPLLDGDSLPASVVANVAVSATTSSRSLLQNYNPLIDANSLPDYSSAVVPIVVSAMTSRASSTITTDSNTTHMIASSSSSSSDQHLSNLNSNNTKNNNDIITILPWPHPYSQYIPMEEEERLLPTLIRWGKKERGMMRDQPEFRLRELHQRIIMSQQQQQCRISLLQSLSLRRHHLKLLNPNLRMTDLRLGSEDDINEAAALFERSVDQYLRRHGVEFWTEKDQQRMHVRNNRYAKQPPTPDFRMKDGHVLDLVWNEEDGDDDAQSNRASNFNHNMSASSLSNDNMDKNKHNSPLPNVTSIHWIEAKMFYGASTIPHDTPNAVGTILSKMKQYVALYGHGALVFMYGCGDQLAKQLLDVGVLALDGRCLDLDEVVRHQKRWCSDARGNILF